jgi:hypothetical protein
MGWTSFVSLDHTVVMQDVPASHYSLRVCIRRNKIIVAQQALCTTRRAGALRRARLLPVCAPCLLMHHAKSAIIRLIVPFCALL